MYRGVSAVGCHAGFLRQDALAHSLTHRIHLHVIAVTATTIPNPDAERLCTGMPVVSGKATLMLTVTPMSNNA
jgi:hypothetical protein